MVAATTRRPPPARSPEATEMSGARVQFMRGAHSVAMERRFSEVGAKIVSFACTKATSPTLGYEVLLKLRSSELDELAPGPVRAAIADLAHHVA
jgi:hypothetical protein